MRMLKLNSNARNQKGGVLLEFSVIVPVLLFICFGLVDIGQAFSQKAWLESVAYQSVMMGGELQEQRVASMHSVTNELVDVLHTKLDKKFVNPSLASSASENETERTVTAVVPGEMRMISNIVKIPYQVALTGPMLVRSGTLLEELEPVATNDKDNDNDDVFYDCFGRQITSDISGGCDLPTDSGSSNGSCNCACAGDGEGDEDGGCNQD